MTDEEFKVEHLRLFLQRVVEGAPVAFRKIHQMDVIPRAWFTGSWQGAAEHLKCIPEQGVAFIGAIAFDERQQKVV